MSSPALQAASSVRAWYIRATHIARSRYASAKAGRHLSPPAKSTDNVELNDDIAKHKVVRLIGEDGTDRGIMSGREAIDQARSAALDVMTVRRAMSRDESTVVRLVDYSAKQEAQKRSAYVAKKEQKEKKLEERRRNSTKQVRLSPSTDRHDFQLKMKQARDFLIDGYRVRVFMQFRRGQGRLQGDAKESLTMAAKELSVYGSLAGNPKEITVEGLFPRPVKDETDGDQNVAGPTVHKPLEVLFQPVKREERLRLRSKVDAALDAQ